MHVTTNNDLFQAFQRAKNAKYCLNKLALHETSTAQVGVIFVLHKTKTIFMQYTTFPLKI